MRKDTIMNIIEALSYPFVRRALVAGLAVGLSSGVLGLFLVLRRYSSIGDGLAHVGLASVALGLATGLAPIYVSAPVTAAAALWILKLSDKSGLFGETAVALVASLAAAVAVLIAGSGGGFAVDLMSYLFGSVLAVSEAEVIVALATAVLVVLLVVVLRKQLFSYVYDPDYARVSGLNVDALGKLLVVLAGLAVSVGIRVVGSLLVSSLIILPPVTALQLGLGFNLTLAFSAGISVVSVLAGILVALAFDLPAGASIVLANFVLFGGVWLVGRLGVGGQEKGRGSALGRMGVGGQEKGRGSALGGSSAGSSASVDESSCPSLKGEGER
ncbi:MAG: metal ABC transporter permease [Rectinemataceae bacterium]